MDAPLFHLVNVGVLAEVEVATTTVWSPLTFFVRTTFFAVLQSGVVEAEPVCVFISQTLIRQHLVQDPSSNRVVEQHLRRSAPVVALLSRQRLRMILECEQVLANWRQLFLR